MIREKHRTSHTDSRPREYSLKESTRINKYLYYAKQLLGTGMSGQVFKGLEIATRQPVAVKVISKQDMHDHRVNQLFRHEVRFLKLLKNIPNIVELKGVQQTQSVYCVITQLCKDGDIGKLIKKQKSIQETKALEYLRNIVLGYQKLIEHKIIHRDLKPNNIFITNGVAKIADFGLAMFQNDKQAAKLNVGSPLYMAPETLAGPSAYSHKADIFSIGLIYYQMLHGRTPWSANTEKQLQYKLKNEPLRLRDGLTEYSKTFLKKALAYNPNDRFSEQQLMSYVCPIAVKQYTSNTSSLKNSICEKATNSSLTKDDDFVQITEINFKNNMFENAVPARYQRRSKILSQNKSFENQDSYPLILANKKTGFLATQKIKTQPKEIAKAGNTTLREFCVTPRINSGKENQFPPRPQKDVTTRRSAKVIMDMIEHENNSRRQSLGVGSVQENINNQLKRRVLQLLSKVKACFKKQYLKFLPPLMVTKLHFITECYQNLLQHKRIIVSVPIELAEDTLVKDIGCKISGSNKLMLKGFVNIVQNFLRRMIRLIAHYLKQNKADLISLSDIFTFYRHLKDSNQEEDYWYRKDLACQSLVDRAAVKQAVDRLMV